MTRAQRWGLAVMLWVLLLRAGEGMLDEARVVTSLVFGVGALLWTSGPSRREP